MFYHHLYIKILKCKWMIKNINENKYFLIEPTTENIPSLMINHYIRDTTVPLPITKVVAAIG